MNPMKNTLHLQFLIMYLESVAVYNTKTHVSVFSAHHENTTIKVFLQFTVKVPMFENSIITFLPFAYSLGYI